MVLASTSDHLPFEELAQLADCLIDMAPLIVTAVTPTPLPETEIARLQSLVQQINMEPPAISHPVSLVAPAPPVPADIPTPAGIPSVW